MSLPVVVRWWLTDDGVIYECRHCGTALEATDRECPVCEATEIVEFDVS